MSEFSKLIQGLKEKLFGKTQIEPDTKPILPSTIPETTVQLPDSSPPVHDRKNPYFVQIGFDFGTSYSKCVCRDIMTNKAYLLQVSRSGAPIPDTKRSDYKKQ